jgi:hypothetical protein
MTVSTFESVTVDPALKTILSLPSPRSARPPVTAELRMNVSLPEVAVIALSLVTVVVATAVVPSFGTDGPQVGAETHGMS